MKYNDGILQFLLQTKEYTLKTRGLLRRDGIPLYMTFAIRENEKYSDAKRT